MFTPRKLEPSAVARVLMPALALLCLWPEISSGIALLLGTATALILGNPYADKTRRVTHTLLGLAVIGLGAGMDLTVVGRVGAHGVLYTAIGIATALGAGYLLTRFLRVEGTTGLLISVGTAICGGSAIAAVAPILKAKPHEVSVSLGTVFLLNAAALFLFPAIGSQLHLSQQQFGLWSALAIHDTSSVVGATMQYGSEAMTVGTTVKLARALWIIPVALLIGHLRARQPAAADGGKLKVPWFIFGFILAAALVTYVPILKPAGQVVTDVAKRGLVLTLFLIGGNLTRTTLKSVGWRPFVLGTTLWALVGSLTLGAIVLGWIT